jgi:hypothetical protein
LHALFTHLRILSALSFFSPCSSMPLRHEAGRGRHSLSSVPLARLKVCALPRVARSHSRSRQVFLFSSPLSLYCCCCFSFSFFALVCLCAQCMGQQNTKPKKTKPEGPSVARCTTTRCVFVSFKLVSLSLALSPYPLRIAAPCTFLRTLLVLPSVRRWVPILSQIIPRLKGYSKIHPHRNMSRKLGSRRGNNEQGFQTIGRALRPLLVQSSSTRTLAAADSWKRSIWACPRLLPLALLDPPWAVASSCLGQDYQTCQCRHRCC